MPLQDLMSGIFEALTRSSLRDRLAGLIEPASLSAGDKLKCGIFLDIMTQEGPMSLTYAGREYCRIPAGAAWIDGLNGLAAIGLVECKTSPSPRKDILFVQWQVTALGKEVFEDYLRWRAELAASIAADADMQCRIGLFAGLFP